MKKTNLRNAKRNITGFSGYNTPTIKSSTEGTCDEFKELKTIHYKVMDTKVIISNVDFVKLLDKERLKGFQEAKKDEIKFLESIRQQMGMDYEAMDDIDKRLSELKKEA